MAVTAQDVVDYWIGLGPAAWYAVDEEVDAEIRARFSQAWEAALAGAFGAWAETAQGALGLLILTDQFPRNMFRGSPRAFATDSRARAVAEAALARGQDLAVPEPERQFFYLPFMHAEDLALQDRCIALMAERMPDTGAGNLPHAKVHREIIRRFGRFPYRNEALGRATTAEERAFLDGGGYAALLREIEAA